MVHNKIENKNAHNSSTYFAIVIIFLIYLMPQSSSLNYAKTHVSMDVFYLARLSILPFFVLYLISRNRVVISFKNILGYILFLMMFVLKMIFLNEFDFAIIYMMVCIFAFDQLLSTKINYKTVNKVIDIALYILIIYSLIYVGKNNRITGSWLDPNIAGYFYYLLFHYFSSIGKKKRGIVVFVLGIITLSRNFLLSSIIYIFIDKIWNKRNRLKVNMVSLMMASLAIVLILSVYYTNYFEANYVVGYSKGLSRLSLSSLVDESNYFRFTSNLHYFSNLNLEHVIFGYDAQEYLLYQNTRNKILPHNLIMSLLVSFGLPLTIVYISKLGKLYSVDYIRSHSGFIIGLVVYYSFLGTASYYGIELILQLIMLKIINNKMDERV